MGGVLTVAATSCTDLDTAPKDQLSPSTTWKTPDDAQKFLVGCYNGWAGDADVLYWDCASDFGFNYHQHEGWRQIGNGTMSSSSTGASSYGHSKIRQCNDFLINIEGVEFADQAEKNKMIAQAKIIRGYKYYWQNWMYGGVPIIDSYETAEEAQVPRNTNEEVRDFIYKEMDEAAAMLPDENPGKGYVGKGTALAIKMRLALYHNDWAVAAAAAKAIMNMGIYSLDSDFLHMFQRAGQDSPEIITGIPHISTLYSGWMLATMCNNSQGGWSSMVPTMAVVDNFEMANGLTKEEDPAYDPEHPFVGRDPRLYQTVVVPGAVWEGYWGNPIVNTLDEKIDGKDNADYPTAADNASKTALTWGKYLLPITQYGDYWNTDEYLILFRYAEVLLSYAEATNEVSGPSNDVYDAIDQVRTRAGMPKVDRAKYSTQSTLRELIRRERGAELAGEGIRRIDIVRWKDASGKMVAETVLNGNLMRPTGTLDYDDPDPYHRAHITGSSVVEARTFAPHNKYHPFSQNALDKNPQLTQNEGY